MLILTGCAEDSRLKYTRHYCYIAKAYSVVQLHHAPTQTALSPDVVSFVLIKPADSCDVRFNVCPILTFVLNPGYSGVDVQAVTQAASNKKESRRNGRFIRLYPHERF